MPSPALLCASLVLALLPQATPKPSDALARARAGDHEGAVRILREVVRANETDGASWEALGSSLHALGRFEEAALAHERAAATPALAARAGYNVACALARLGRSEDALARLRQAVAAGFGDRGLLATDTDLDPLREDPRFAGLLPPLLEDSEAFAERPRVLHTFVGRGANEQFGWVARAVGDLDGDGAIDFASTAPGAAGGNGRVDVFSSRSGRLLFSAAGEAGWGLGNSVAGGLDVDKDGTPDVVTGAPSASRALVLSGKDGRVLHTLAGAPGEQFGLKVCLLEDLDGDASAEVAVTARNAGGGRGRVVVFSGASGAELFRIDGEAQGEQLGSAVDATLDGGQHLLAVGAMGVRRCDVFRCGARGAEKLFSIRGGAGAANLGQYFVTFLGDVDGDGTSDVFASDWMDSNGTGRVYVHSGRTGERLLEIPGEPGEQFGTSASSCGDADGDGHADLVVGAWQSALGAPSGGRCALHSGKDGSLLAMWTGLQGGDTLGFDAVGLGDVDGDGSPDFLLSAAWSTLAQARQGRVFLVALPGR